METSIDQFGRIVIPKKIREHFALEAGTPIRIEETEDTIVLKPIFGEPDLHDRDGVLVFSGVLTGDIDQALSRHRNERVASLG